MKQRPLHKRQVATRQRANLARAERFLRFAYGPSWRQHVARLWSADGTPLLDSEID